MKVTIRITLLFLLISLLFTSLSAQSWTNLEDGSGKIDFHSVMNEFDTYWKDRTPGKGKGYKPIRRWEYRWENRIDKNGNFPPADYNIKTFNSYVRNNMDQTRDVTDPWIGLGPNSNTSGYAGTGRIMSIDWHPTNNNIIYVGSAGGGLWKTIDAGASWLPKTDFIGALGVSAILVDPNTPNTIYIGTGDFDGYDNFSIGVLKSTDGGDTWNSTGLNWGSTSYRRISNMVFDPNNSDIITLASNNGIYRTTNAGTTWTQVQTGSFRDIDINPLASSNTYYATTNNTILRSTDNGVNWNTIQTITGSNRLAIATTADNSDYLYVLASNSADNGLLGVWRSTDSGDTFTQMVSNADINLLGWNSAGTDSGGQGWYDLVIAADPNDAEAINVGGVNNWRSIDGGVNWTISSHWSGSGAQAVHADKHLLEWNGSVLWEGNDGGIYKSTNNGDTWTDVTSDMVISQMYKVGVSETDNRVMAGLQDNGSKLRNNNTNWTDEIGGDGMDCAINPLDSDVLYGAIQNGNIRRSTNGGGSWSGISSNIPGNPSGAWVTPYVLDPSNPSTIIAGYKSVWKSTNQGNNWTNIGDNISTINLQYVAISPSNSDYIYTGTAGTMFRTTDGGLNWTTLSTPGSNTAMVKVSPNDPEVIYAVRSEFSSGEKVYKSTNGGTTWSNISGTLPNLFANCIAIHNDEEETLYVGMDIGVYYKNNSTPNWTLFNVDLPNVEVKEIEIKESTNEIYIATYGRGVWKNNTIEESTLCNPPQNVEITNLTYNSFDVSWVAPTDTPSNGYIWAYSTDGVLPASTTTETGLAISLNGLTSGTGYYFHIRSDCGTSSKSAWLTSGPYLTKFGCGDTYYDSGGQSANYGNAEDQEITLCPNAGSGAITLTFNSLDIESTWDALYLYDGDDINATQFDSGNPATQAGFPAGGFYGSTVPGPFTSTAASGCITLRFRSDNFVTGTGWEADISCASGCNLEVTNLDDSGPGSLRDVISCMSSGEIVTVNPSLYGNSIKLNSQISITKDVIMALPGSNTIDISTVGSGPLFLILSDASLELDQVTLTSGTSSNGSAIINIGSLILHDVEVLPNANNSSPSSLIQNNGTMKIDGLSTIKK